VNQAEIDGIGALAPEAAAAVVPWARLRRSANLQAILAMYFTFGYTGYIYITWLPSYLREARHLSVEMTAVFVSLPAVLSAISKPFGGWWSDRESARRGLRFGRRLVGPVQDGYVEPPNRPGIGVELNETEAAKHPYGRTNFLRLFEAGWEMRK
jgi:hypothetical protein